MEQRALIASALVLGCVTAAGAGGYVAVRQLASSSPAPVTEAEMTTTATDATGTADPLAGTIAEIDPAPAPRPEPEAPASPVISPPAPTAAAARAERPVDRRADRPVVAPAAPTTQRPAPRTPRPSASAPAPTASAPIADPPSPATPSSTRDASGADPWPSRDSGAATTDTWPSRDAGVDTTTADASLPSRSPVNDTPAPSAPARRMETVTIPADAVINVQIESGVSSASARVEDVVRARITRDVVSGGGVVIPAGARLMGNVTLVDEGGRMRERARLGIRFHTLVLADGSEVRLPTETIYREGESPAKGSAAKIGGAAVGGAILGAIMGGGKGAVIGAATGAGSGTGWAMAGDRRPAELRSGQALAVRVSDSVTTEIVR
ncbi:TrbI/VirB10 family protein [Luteitalea sp.]